MAPIYADGDGAFIKLEKPDVEPEDGYFRLNQSNANYHAMYSLALAAAIDRYVLQIRTKGDISAFRHAEVAYLGGRLDRSHLITFGRLPLARLWNRACLSSLGRDSDRHMPGADVVRARAE